MGRSTTGIATDRATLTFVVPEHKVAFGERVALVGNTPELGAWDPERAVPMDWSPGHNWRVDIALSSRQAVEFKVSTTPAARDAAACTF